MFAETRRRARIIWEVLRGRPAAYRIAVDFEHRRIAGTIRGGGSHLTSCHFIGLFQVPHGGKWVDAAELNAITEWSS